MYKIQVFWHFLKNAYCVTMKLGFRAYQKYFQACLNPWYPEAIEPEKAEIGQYSGWAIFSKSCYCVTMNLGLQIYQTYFSDVCKSWSRTIFSVPF